jgi:Ca2+-binding RTX toxin-like protein
MTRNSRRRSGAMVTTAMLMTMAALPGSALASSVALTSGQLSYTASFAEQNDVSMEVVGASVRVIDEGTLIPATLPTGCTRVDSHTFTCGAAAITSVLVDVKDGDDSVDLNLPATKPARILGGPGSDTLSGGEGNDLLDAGTGDYATLDGRGGGDTIDGSQTQWLVAAGGSGADRITGGTSPSRVPTLNVCTAPLTLPRSLLDGGPGDDSLQGSGGTITMLAGAGRDTFTGSAGFDTVSYATYTTLQPLRVRLNGVADDGSLIGGVSEGDSLAGDIDRIIGGFGADVISGDSLPNELYGCGGNDTITGLGDNDVLSGDLGVDRLDGGDGDDSLNDDQPGASRLLGGAGADVLSARSADAIGTTVVKDVQGGPGDDVLAGSSGRDSLVGGDGNDTLDGGLGPDTLQGDGGIDTVDYSLRSTAVNVTLGDAAANDGAAGEGDIVMPGVENVVGGKLDDVLVGSPTDNQLVGGKGNDTLRGLDGNDSLCGAKFEYNPYTRATGCDDTSFSFAGEQNRLEGGNGDDTMVGSDGGPDTYIGGPGSDTASYATRRAGILVTIDGLPNDGAGSEEDNVGTDVEGLVGGVGADTLTGGSLANSIDGAAGNDALAGGPGNDLIVGGLGSDSMVGGTGFDYVSYASSTKGVTVTVGDDTFNDGAPLERDNVRSDVEGVQGSSLNDALTGSALNNHLVGAGGDDVLTGNAGNDSLAGGPGVDKFVGGAGADRLNSRDGIGGESVDCGTEIDTALVDDTAPTTDVLTGCETVSGASAPTAMSVAPSRTRIGASESRLEHMRSLAAYQHSLVIAARAA